MPTTVQLPSTNLNNIESSSSQTNTNNLQSLGKWNTTPEHLKQVTNNIEKQQQIQQQPKEHQQTNTKNVQSNTKNHHHLPPITRKTILGPVPQARSSISHSHHLASKEPLQTNTNYRAIYQPTSNSNNLMASYISSNGQEWIVTKQRIQRPQDHNVLTLSPVVNNHFVQNLPLTDADIRKQEFIERKIAQEKYRQQLEHQILQQKPVKPFKPRTTLKFDGETDFKTETRQNYKPFRFVTSLNDLDKKGLDNEKIRKQSIEKEHHVIQQQNNQQQHNQQQHNQQQISNKEHQQICNKSNRPQSSLTTSGKFKEHLQNQPDQIPQQRRHINQIDHHYQTNDLDQPTYEKEQELVEELVDENNNVIDARNHQQQHFKNIPQQQNEAICCDHCRHHYLKGINVPLGSATSQNQIELNPLIGTRALANKQMNQRLNDSGQSVKRNFKIKEQPYQQQQNNLVRSKSTHFYTQEKQNDGTIPRMIIPGKQKPHKNMSHLKFEGKSIVVL